jgi:hypothetical protein
VGGFGKSGQKEEGSDLETEGLSLKPGSWWPLQVVSVKGVGAGSLVPGCHTLLAVDRAPFPSFLTLFGPLFLHSFP